MNYFEDDSDADTIERGQIKPRRVAPTAPVRPSTEESKSALESKNQMPVDAEEDDQEHNPLIKDNEADEHALPTVQAELDMTVTEQEEEEGEMGEEEEEAADAEEESEDSGGEEEFPTTAGQYYDPQPEEEDYRDEDIDEPLELHMYQDDQAMFDDQPMLDDHVAALLF